MEPQDDGFGGRSQDHVGFGDGADRAVDDFERNLLRIDFLKRLNDGLDRALSVGLDDDAEDFAGFRGECFEEVFQGHLRTPLLVFAADLIDAIFGHCPRVFFVLDDAEFQAGFRDAIQAEHLDGDRGSRFLEPLAFLANQRARLAVVLAADDDIAHAQRAFAHEHRGDRAAGFEAGFDDVALGAAVRVGLQLQQIRLEQ